VKEKDYFEGRGRDVRLIGNLTLKRNTMRGCGLVHLAQDRVMWTDVANMAKNFYIP
jgi:hypothetical protein